MKKINIDPNIQCVNPNMRYIPTVEEWQDLMHHSHSSNDSEISQDTAAAIIELSQNVTNSLTEQTQAIQAMQQTFDTKIQNIQEVFDSQLQTIKAAFEAKEESMQQVINTQAQTIQSMQTNIDSLNTYVESDLQISDLSL